jgi:hypothetical protein
MIGNAGVYTFCTTSDDGYVGLFSAAVPITLQDNGFLLAQVIHILEWRVDCGQFWSPWHGSEVWT